MKQILKENGGLPASILWTLAIVAGISVANLYYNQPLLNMIRHELGVSEFETNLIAMVTQIGYALDYCLLVPLGDLYQSKADHSHQLLHINRFVAGDRDGPQHPRHPVCLAPHRHLFGDATDIHPDSFPILTSGKQREKCRNRRIGTTDRHFGLTCSQRVYRRTVWLA